MKKLDEWSEVAEKVFSEMSDLTPDQQVDSLVRTLVTRVAQIGENVDRADLFFSELLWTFPIAKMRFGRRIETYLARVGITTLSELLSRTPDQILSIRGFGGISMGFITARLEDFGLRLGCVMRKKSSNARNVVFFVTSMGVTYE